MDRWTITSDATQAGPYHGVDNALKEAIGMSITDGDVYDLHTYNERGIYTPDTLRFRVSYYEEKLRVWTHIRAGGFYQIVDTELDTDAILRYTGSGTEDTDLSPEYTNIHGRTVM